MLLRLFNSLKPNTKKALGHLTKGTNTQFSGTGNVIYNKAAI